MWKNIGNKTIMKKKNKFIIYFIEFAEIFLNISFKNIAGKIFVFAFFIFSSLTITFTKF